MDGSSSTPGSHRSMTHCFCLLPAKPRRSLNIGTKYPQLTPYLSNLCTPFSENQTNPCEIHFNPHPRASIIQSRIFYPPSPDLHQAARGACERSYLGYRLVRGSDLFPRLTQITGSSRSRGQPGLPECQATGIRSTYARLMFIH